MEQFKKIFGILISLLSLFSVGYGMRCAMHSSLFILQDVELVSSDHNPPVETSSLIRLARAPVGKANLFELELKPIENRLFTNDWIDQVRIQKKFPNTLLISIEFKKPIAIIQFTKNTFSYVDSQGKVFGKINLNHSFDLPLLLGFTGPKAEKIKGAIQIIESWQRSTVNEFTLLSSIHWEVDKGFRILASYPLGRAHTKHPKDSKLHARTMIDLGHDIDFDLNDKLTQLASVFSYLNESSIAVRQVRADVGKKVVVKTAQGS